MKYSLTKHYKYKLEETEKIRTVLRGLAFGNRHMSMSDGGLLIIRSGYAWDGSSVPYKRLCRFVSFGLYDPDRYCKPASLAHDALCQAMREGLLPTHCKLAADRLYQNMCVAGGMSKKQALRRYKALRKFGDSGIKPEKNPRNKVFEI